MKKIAIIILTLIFITGLCGCSSNINSSNISSSNTNSPPNQEEHKVLIMADSYGSGKNSVNDNTVIPFTELVKQNLENNHYILKLEVKTHYLGGSGFTTKEIKNAETQLRDIWDSMEKEETKEITDIIFCYGFNDRYAEIGELNTAIYSISEYADKAFPNANLYLFTTGWGTEEVDQEKLEILYNQYRFKDNHKSLPFIYHNVSHVLQDETHSTNDTITKDGVHPTALGNIKIAHEITRILIDYWEKI